MCGVSGVGKRTGLIRILNLYPQIIIHTNYKRKKFTRAQIVWLILECPKDGSTKGLCTKFFKAIDYVMGGTTDYSKNYGKESRSTNDLMDSMANIAATHQLGVLIIDEIQYLNVAKSGGAEEMLNFFVNLVNAIGLPVVIVGTYDAVPLLTGTFRQARRGSGQGDLVWDRMALDEEWHLFAATLWEYQYVQKKCPFTEQLSDVLHNVSHGIIDIANRIYLASQVRAIENGTEEITEGLLRSAYRDDFRLVSHIIETLKTGDPSLLHNVRDVCPPAILPIKAGAANSSTSFSKEQEIEGIEHIHSAGSDQRDSLPSSNIEAEALTGQESESTQRDDIFPSNTPANIAKRRPKKRLRKSGIIEANFEERDLRGVVARGQSSTPQVDSHRALLAAGYIKDSAEFLSKDC